MSRAMFANKVRPSGERRKMIFARLDGRNEKDIGAAVQPPVLQAAGAGGWEKRFAEIRIPRDDSHSFRIEGKAGLRRHQYEVAFRVLRIHQKVVGVLERTLKPRD